MSRKKKIKKERGANWEPKVRFREERGVWMVDLGSKFTPRKIYFATQEEATAKANEKRAEHLANISAKKVEKKQEAKNGSAVRLSGLNELQRGDIAAALAKAGNDSAIVARAVEFYLKHHGTAGTSRKLCRVYREYITEKRHLGRRHATVKDAHVKLHSFIKAFRTAKVSDITTGDVERWLASRHFTPITRNSYRAAIVALFNHAVDHRYIEVNPATVIKLALMDQTLPGIHTVAEVRRLLLAASEYVPTVEYAVKEWRKGKNGKKEEVPGTAERKLETDPDKIEAARARILPYLAIGYFAGLRPQNELANLDWKDIDFTDRTIRVNPATAKKRRQRYVDMSDNLVQWLAPYARKEGKIGFSRFIFRAVRKTANIEWPKDVMRHCFGTYHSAMHEDNGKTSAQMGHTRTSELFKSYKNLVKKSAAAEYWKIMPEKNHQIIQFPTARAG
jgi:integrase